MIYVSIECSSVTEKAALRDKCCYALQGSPAFVNSEIAVCDNPKDENSFDVIIGNDNSNNIYKMIKSSDIMDFAK